MVFEVFNRKLVVFAFLMMFFSLLDSYYTIISINKYGISGERNPFALFLFKLGLSKNMVNCKYNCRFSHSDSVFSSYKSFKQLH
jgi:hypothetical protein